MATDVPENALYRSRIEICRILQMLLEQDIPLHAGMGRGRTFISRLAHVDQRGGRFCAAYCANKLLNAMMLRSASAQFTASFQGAHIAFKVFGRPVETQVNGRAVLRFMLPSSLTICHRRECPRFTLPANASLRCVADAGGFLSFESHITDISHDGFGSLSYSGDIHLDTGTVLKGCRVILPDGNAVVADLELRYTLPVTLPDGTIAHRSGFRFIQRPDEVTRLVDFFIQDMDRE